MNTKLWATGAMVVGMIGGIAGIRSAAGGTSDIAHADVSIPNVVVSATQLNPLSVDLSGTDFTPGGAVHADLTVAYWSDCAPSGSGSPMSPTPVPSHVPGNQTAPRIVGSLDTMAARTVNVPNGHGIVFHKVGGYFSASLTSSVPTLGGFSYWLVVTDQATGRTVTTAATGAVSTDANCR
jgi:hypothetical protein